MANIPTAPAADDPFKDGLEIARTPSPTPSEQRALDDDGKIHLRRLFRRENWVNWAIGVALIAATVITTIFQTPIVRGLHPATKWLARTPGAWAVPIGVLIILCIPPLFGEEVVLLLIGLAWRPVPGMAIGATGLLLGQLSTFFTFKSLLRTRAARYEARSLEYAIIARIVRDGGLLVAVLARYSLISDSLLTALFAACDMGPGTFLLASIFALPNQLINVYLGYDTQLQTDHHSTVVTDAVNYGDIAVSVLATACAWWYLRRLQLAATPVVVAERRRQRAVPSDLEAYSGSPVLYAPRPEHTELGLAPNVRTWSEDVMLEERTSGPPVAEVQEDISSYGLTRIYQPGLSNPMSSVDMFITKRESFEEKP